MNLNIVGPYRDKSGYGMLSRNIVLEIIKRNIPLKLEALYSIPESMQAPLKPEDAKSVYLAETVTLESTHNLIISTPDAFVYRRKPGIPNVGFTMFETNRIPKTWVDACNTLDLIFVPSTWNKQVFMDSGVTKPIAVIPLGIHHTDVDQHPIIDIPDKFKFYSIFEFTHRKDYMSLISSYYSAFAGVKDVILVMKTYFVNAVEANKLMIRNTIGGIKNAIMVDHPEIVLIEDILSDDEISQIHKDCDCFVLPTRGEGFGLPIADAMYFGKPVITTGYSGQMDFCRGGNSYLCGYTREPVYGAHKNPAYEGTMLWAKVDSEDLIETMKYVYNNREKAKKVGLAGQDTIKNEFTIDIMMETILRNLKNL